jgi:hypothetical protein
MKKVRDFIQENLYFNYEDLVILTVLVLIFAVFYSLLSIISSIYQIVELLTNHTTANFIFYFLIIYLQIFDQLSSDGK